MELKNQLGDTANQEEIIKLKEKLQYTVKQFQSLKDITTAYKNRLAIKEKENTILAQMYHYSKQQRFYMTDDDVNKITIKGDLDSWYANMKTSIAQECLKRRWVNFWLVICIVGSIFILSMRW